MKWLIFSVQVTFCYARHVSRALYKAALIAYFVHTPATTRSVANYYICTEYHCLKNIANIESDGYSIVSNGLAVL